MEKIQTQMRTAAVLEPAAGKRERSATCRQAWLVAASYVDADGSEQPRLQAVGKVPVAAMGSRAPKGAATKNTQITEQSTHQAAIWAALVYASTCLSRGSRVTHVCRCCVAIETRPFEPVEAEGGASMPCGSAHRQGVGGAVAPPWGRPVGSGRRKVKISKRKKRKAKR